MSVLIIDYGTSNLGSARRAFEECGAQVFVSDDPKDILTASKLVLPGVGTFKAGMTLLRDIGWVPAIRQAVQEEGIPLLGICLGMQLLADAGYEGGQHVGLGLISGAVKRLEPDKPGIRIPHVGWNEVYPEQGSRLFSGIPAGSDFYFVHSYHFVPKHKDAICATTPYCGSFVSAVGSDMVFGVQFHPEKSGRLGFQLIKNFLRI